MAASRKRSYVAPERTASPPSAVEAHPLLPDLERQAERALRALQHHRTIKRRLQLPSGILVDDCACYIRGALTVLQETLVGRSKLRQQFQGDLSSLLHRMRGWVDSTGTL